VTLLRDGERIATEAVLVSPPLDVVLGWLDGRTARSVIDARAATQGIDASAVDALLDRLERVGMLDGPTARLRAARLVREFQTAATRAAGHAGGAYPGEAAELARFVREECLAPESTSPSNRGRAEREPVGRLVGIAAPHMDLFRARDGYGRSYRCMDALRTGRERVFFVLGTCHAGMQSAFAFTKKSFATPLGTLRADPVISDRVAARAKVDVYRDEYKHKGEHSLEFQMVFLAHLLGEDGLAQARVVPILCGLGRAQARRADPTSDDESERIVRALEDEVASLDGEAFIVAGADLAHVGPRFGDSSRLDATGRSALEARDLETCNHLEVLDSRRFFAHATEDLDERRVCGVGPLYTIARLARAAGAEQGSMLGYSQCVDRVEGSVVSYASMAFHG